MKNIIGFEYKFSSLNDILEQVKNTFGYSIMDLIFMILLITFVICLVFYVFPFLNYLLEKRKKDLKSRYRKNLLLKIKTQKDIEDEIDEEMREEDKAKLQNRTKILNNYK